MSIANLRTKVITNEKWGNETITICILSTCEYRRAFAELVQEYGTPNMFNDFITKKITPELFEVISRMDFLHIVEWTLEDCNGEPLEKTYANYEHLPYTVGIIVADAIAELNDGGNNEQ